MEDTLFQVAMVTYLGQACPLIKPVVGRYFEKKGQVLDKYGSNMAAAALPGQGHSALHNKPQAILQAMMKLGGVFSEKEAVNFTLDKVGDPYITAYVNNVSSYQNARKSTTFHRSRPQCSQFPSGQAKS